MLSSGLLFPLSESLMKNHFGRKERVGPGGSPGPDEPTDEPGQFHRKHDPELLARGACPERSEGAMRTKIGKSLTNLDQEELHEYLLPTQERMSQVRHSDWYTFRAS